MQLANYLKGAQLVWTMPLDLHVNKKEPTDQMLKTSNEDQVVHLSKIFRGPSQTLADLHKCLNS